MLYWRTPIPKCFKMVNDSVLFLYVSRITILQKCYKILWKRAKHLQNYVEKDIISKKYIKVIMFLWQKQPINWYNSDINYPIRNEENKQILNITDARSLMYSDTFRRKISILNHSNWFVDNYFTFPILI